LSTPSPAIVAAVVALATVLPLTGCSANKSAPTANTQGTDATTQPTPAPTNVARKQKNAQLNKWLADVDVAVPPSTYRVDPPDVIKITAPAVKEVDQTSARIRTDGKISLNLLGDVYVAGMSPSEIAEDLTSRLGKFYNKETIFVSVEVTEFASKKYYVFGQVNSPGVKSYTGRDTVIKVLAEAALNDDAWPQKVVLIRPNEDPNVRQKVTIDLKQMYLDGKTDQNFLLEEGDLVFVPPSPLAELRIQMTKLLTPIMPVADFAMMAYTGGF
jgi:polysaccharide export outer membrane protein